MMEDIEDLFDTPDSLSDSADDHDIDFSSHHDHDHHHHPHHTVFDSPPLDGDDFGSRGQEKRARTKRSYVALILFAIVIFIFLLSMIRIYA
jgi:hypothetical protein